MSPSSSSSKYTNTLRVTFTCGSQDIELETIDTNHWFGLTTWCYSWCKKGDCRRCTSPRKLSAECRRTARIQMEYQCCHILEDNCTWCLRMLFRFHFLRRDAIRFAIGPMTLHGTVCQVRSVCGTSLGCWIYGIIKRLHRPLMVAWTPWRDHCP